MKIRALLALSLALPLVLSCNVYAPFTTNSSDEDRLEEGQKCLHDNDFACAIRSYEALTDTVKKNEKLCTTYLSQSGFTLNALINTVNGGGSDMLGKFAFTLIPFTLEKLEAAEKAKTTCVEYANSVPSTESLATLLRTMAYLNDCAIRIARIDQFVAVSESDLTCNTTEGNRDGRITKSEVGPSSGVISSAAPGMCKPDADACKDDILKIDPSQLNVTGFGDLKSAYDSLPAELKNSAAATQAIRVALRDAIND